MVYQLADDRVLQHHVADCHLNIDYQAAYFLFLSQNHGTDDNISAVFQCLSDVVFIFLYMDGYFVVVFHLEGPFPLSCRYSVPENRMDLPHKKERRIFLHLS